MSDLIKPSLPGGFKDYGPDAVLARQRMLRAIEDVYRRFGFVPLQTSIVQRRQVLTGGKPAAMRMWDMRVDTSGITTDEAQRLTARFDLTVPLARFVAENMTDIRFPFRRYEYGDVFRGESPQAGRYCEFMQFDADIVGAPTGPADAEIILCMAEVMRALGISRFRIKVNNRKILNGFAAKLRLPPEGQFAAGLMRVMDKADKIGVDGVLDELAGKAASDEEGAGFTLGADGLAEVRAFMTLTDGLPDNAARLAALRSYFGGEGLGAEGVAELATIAALVEAGGMPPEAWAVDASIARGLGYYTGPVFETTLLDKPEFGSVYSGGRFDDLVARFTGMSLPSVGASVGVDRLFAALQALGTAGVVEPEVDAFIVRMDPSLDGDYFALAADLRRAGLRVEIGMSHQDTSMKSQLTTALVRRAPVVIFFGGNEKAAGEVKVKTTADRKQTAVPRGEAAARILTILGRSA